MRHDRGLIAVQVYLPLAHVGHWYWVVIFMLPALLVLGGAIWMALHERRRAREDEDPAQR